MTRGEALISAGVVFAVALLVRVVAAGQIVFPSPEDTAYYVAVARNLLDGRGLVSDALWSYGTPPLILPRPAFEVWLPLPTFLAAIPMAIFNPSFAAAQVSSVIVGALVPVLGWRLAADVAQERGLPLGRARVFALGVGLTCAVYLPLVLHSALPDSTMPFAALSLAACIVMARIVRTPAGASTTPLIVMLGVLLGLAAWTRNEAVWLALTWVIVAWVGIKSPPAQRVRLIALTAVVALLVFAPWAVRNAMVFGSPFPGQALTNALSLDGRDIFAWSEEPTLGRYLAAGPAALLQLRITGVLHNLLNVLTFLGIPLSVIGLAALPWHGRARALQPLLLFSVLTFLVTSLLFPVATTWGTFLHASGAVHVLLVISSLAALDAAIVRIGRFRGWTRPVAWLGPTLTIFGSALFTLALLPSFGSGARETQTQYTELQARMAAVGQPFRAGQPVITNFPIWLSETAGVPALALPDEPISSVLDLAHYPAFAGTKLVIVEGREHRHWPDDIDAGEPGSQCFREIDLHVPPEEGSHLRTSDPLAQTRVFEIVCP